MLLLVVGPAEAMFIQSIVKKTSSHPLDHSVRLTAKGLGPLVCYSAFQGHLVGRGWNPE
jgi:hypothetical protein